MKGQLPLNHAKVCVIGRDHPGADTSCRQGDQHLTGPLTQLGGLIVLSPSELMEDLGGPQPLLLRGRLHLAPPTQFQNKLPLSGGSSPAKQFVEYDGRTRHDERRLQQAKREAAGSEIINVDRGIEQRELSGLRRRHRDCPHRYSAG